ncbi:hypothetical protein D3C77_337360 [compost metagenome]
MAASHAGEGLLQVLHKLLDRLLPLHNDFFHNHIRRCSIVRDVVYTFIRNIFCPYQHVIGLSRYIFRIEYVRNHFSGLLRKLRRQFAAVAGNCF